MQLIEVALFLLPYYKLLCYGIFAIGLVRIALRWSKSQQKLSEYEASWLIDVPFKTKFWAFIKTAISDWTIGNMIRRQSISRWIKHGFILVGVVGLIIFHGLPRLVFLDESILFPWATLEMRILAHNALLLVLGVGILLAFINRVSSKEAREVSSIFNFFPLFLLLAITITGFYAFSFEFVVGIKGVSSILHSIIIFGTIAAIPFSKFLHVIATPIVILRHSIEQKWKERYVREVTGVEIE